MGQFSMQGMFVFGADFGANQHRVDKNPSNTRIFRTLLEAHRLYFSVSYRGVRCPTCSTMQYDTIPVHAIVTH